MEASPRREAGGNEYASILSDQLTLDILKNFCLRDHHWKRDGNITFHVFSLWFIFTGKLTISFQIHLKCLPLSKAEWVTVTTRNRNLYASLKQKDIPNPHDDRFCQDPQINNPLDQTDHNPWQQYFADHDLRDLIMKDVGRTFPELEFFQQDHIRRMMCDILLIYAKENPFVSYKQGMHEILAPLIFVLFSDQQSFCHCLETGGLTVQDAAPTNQVMRELVAIGERLQCVDPELAEHLNSLDIPPQLYGIRWLRLLFGREFAIHDLLYVWDVLVCDRPVARMVECVFLAMLVQIRHLLLQSDYGGCLQYLMRYPPIVDVSTFIQQALHYRNPKKYPKPTTVNSLGNFSHLTVTGADHPNRARQGVMMVNDMGDVRQDEISGGLRNITSTMLSKVKNSMLERPSLLAASPPLTPRRMTQSAAKSPSWEKELRLMEEQVACLQIRLNERDVVCLEAARNIESCVEQLRSYDRDGFAGLCAKLMEISGNLTASTVNGVGNSAPSRRNDDEALERRSSFNRAPPQPRHIQRENEMVDLKLWLTKILPYTVQRLKGPYLISNVLRNQCSKKIDSRCIPANNDIVLITPNIEQAERMLAEFDSAWGKIGLRRNLTKTMFMKNELVPDAPFTLNGTNISECSSYDYLGREVNIVNDLTPELCRRKRAAWGAFKNIEGVVKKTKNIRLRAHLFDIADLPALTYASETWTLRKQDEHAVSVTQRALERTMLGISLYTQVQKETRRVGSI
ncbi:unnamed protein product [Haemonchus placei]|uniref:Rab-GAP TBC domain-containing protein n=1 Tax=Haemonchus placei TaxID=6290 RepID=A0A0N4WRX1_HAEPC|nr:unnamed protein product [Haemonchus placei]